MIPIREILAARRDNAVYALLSRRLRSPGQIAMLATATVAGASVSLLAFLAIGSGWNGLLLWFIARWGLGELIWCWMTADHIFSEYRRASSSGQLDEWLVTNHSREEIARGVVLSGVALLAAAILAWSIFDVVAIGFLDGDIARVIAVAAFEALLAASHVQSVRWTAWRCFAAVCQSGATPAAWAGALARIAGQQLLILAGCTGMFLVLSSLLQVYALLSIGTSFAAEERICFAYASVLIVSPVAKMAFARRAWRDAMHSFDPRPSSLKAT